MSVPQHVNIAAIALCDPDGTVCWSISTQTSVTAARHRVTADYACCSALVAVSPTWLQEGSATQSAYPCSACSLSLKAVTSRLYGASTAAYAGKQATHSSCGVVWFGRYHTSVHQYTDVCDCSQTSGYSALCLLQYSGSGNSDLVAGEISDITDVSMQHMHIAVQNRHENLTMPQERSATQSTHPCHTCSLPLYAATSWSYGATAAVYWNKLGAKQSSTTHSMYPCSAC
jgi:hypothetical protein